jgi:hypothetical protein
MSGEGPATLDGEFLVEDVEAVVKSVGFVWGRERGVVCFVGASQPPTSSYATAALSMQALQVTLSDASYDAAKVAPWTNTVIDTVLKGLVALGRPFKYIGGLARMPRLGPDH